MPLTHRENQVLRDVRENLQLPSAVKPASCGAIKK